MDIVLIGNPFESTDWYTWSGVPQFILREDLVIKEISKWSVVPITEVGQAELKVTQSRRIR